MEIGKASKKSGPKTGVVLKEDWSLVGVVFHLGLHCTPFPLLCSRTDQKKMYLLVITVCH